MLDSTNRPNYEIPDNPEYSEEIPILLNDDPASATETFNPWMQRIVNNLAALWRRGDGKLPIYTIGSSSAFSDGEVDLRLSDNDVNFENAALLNAFFYSMQNGIVYVHAGTYDFGITGNEGMSNGVTVPRGIMLLGVNRDTTIFTFNDTRNFAGEPNQDTFCIRFRSIVEGITFRNRAASGSRTNAVVFEGAICKNIVTDRLNTRQMNDTKIEGSNIGVESMQNFWGDNVLRDTRLGNTLRIDNLFTMNDNTQTILDNVTCGGLDFRGAINVRAQNCNVIGNVSFLPGVANINPGNNHFVNNRVQLGVITSPQTGNRIENNITG